VHDDVSSGERVTLRRGQAIRSRSSLVPSTEVVLAQAAKKRKPVLLASTSEVYGKSKSFPFPRTATLSWALRRPAVGSYDCSKTIDEFLALAYWKERKLPTVVARLFNTVGPRQTGRYGMVVPTFVAQALSGRPLTVFGDGMQTRCFCHADDVATALVDLILLGDAAYREVFNIGSLDEISIMGLADRARELTASESEMHIIPYQDAYEAGFEDMPPRYPDVRRSRGRWGGRRRGRWTRSLST